MNHFIFIRPGRFAAPGLRAVVMLSIRLGLLLSSPRNRKKTYGCHQRFPIGDAMKEKQTNKQSAVVHININIKQAFAFKFSAIETTVRKRECEKVERLSMVFETTCIITRLLAPHPPHSLSCIVYVV